MKAKILSILLVSIVLVTLSVRVVKSGAFFNALATGTEMQMQLGEWQPAVSSVVGIKNGVEYALTQELVSTQKTQDVVLTSNHFISFLYRVTSLENLDGFDRPNFLVKVSDQVAYQDKAELEVWHRGFVDLSKYDSNEGEYHLEFLANNTFDGVALPTVEVKEVSSASFLAKQGDLLKFSLSKANAEIHLEYVVDENGVVVHKQDVLQAPFEWSIDKELASNEVEYFSVDEFGNVEESKRIELFTDFVKPNPIDIQGVFYEGDGEISLLFEVEVNNSIAPISEYVIKVADQEVTQASWQSATQLELLDFSQFIKDTLPLQITTESLVAGFRQAQLVSHTSLRGTKHLAVRVADLAGNWSQVSDDYLVEIND